MERPRLAPTAADLGLAGLALLRLHAARNLSAVRECIEDIRALVAVIDIDDVQRRNPLVDVVSGYRRWAAVYDRPGNPLVEGEEPVVRAMLDDFAQDPVLDAACGTGRHLTYLAQRGRRVIGVDLSPEMLERARAKLPALPEEPDLRRGDLLALPVADGEAAAALCTLALEHVDDLRAAYAELARVVRSGAPVVVSTMHPVMRTVFGWGAWFVDDEGRLDVPSHPHSVADHVNAAASVGLALRRLEEPVVPESLLSAPHVTRANRLAYRGVPIVLVLQFERDRGGE